MLPFELQVRVRELEAQRRSRSWSEKRIADCLIDDFGYTERKARLTAAHIKGADCWQEACDAK